MYAFVGGTSAAGKTYTVKQFIKTSGLDIYLVSIDDLRAQFAKNPKVKPWVEIFGSQDEEHYWKTTSYEQDIGNLVKQSESFWPYILDEVKKTKKIHKHAIFEAVNIQPHLAKKDLSFPGFFLVNEDYNTILQRLEKTPRWGKTKKLQELETKFLLKHDIPFIKNEAKKYGYKVFNNSEEALKELKEIFS